MVNLLHFNGPQHRRRHMELRPPTSPWRNRDLMGFAGSNHHRRDDAIR